MATFASLTPTQQALVTSYLSQYLRPGISAFAQQVLRMAAIDVVWQNTVLPLVTSLDAGAAIPDVTGLAAAAPMVREEVLNMMTLVEAMLSTHNSAAARTAYTKAGGINAVIPA